MSSNFILRLNYILREKAFLPCRRLNRKPAFALTHSACEQSPVDASEALVSRWGELWHLCVMLVQIYTGLGFTNAEL